MIMISIDSVACKATNYQFIQLYSKTMQILAVIKHKNYNFFYCIFLILIATIFLLQSTFAFIIHLVIGIVSISIDKRLISQSKILHCSRLNFLDTIDRIG